MRIYIPNGSRYMQRLASRVSKLEIFKPAAEKTEDYETVRPGGALE